eukprot:scaffold61199_cov66-Phaeocystis_antarctica.AAC.1
MKPHAITRGRLRQKGRAALWARRLHLGRLARAIDAKRVRARQAQPPPAATLVPLVALPPSCLAADWAAGGRGVIIALETDEVVVEQRQRLHRGSGGGGAIRVVRVLHLLLLLIVLFVLPCARGVPRGHSRVTAPCRPLGRCRRRVRGGLLEHLLEGFLPESCPRPKLVHGVVLIVVVRSLFSIPVLLLLVIVLVSSGVHLRPLFPLASGCIVHGKRLGDVGGERHFGALLAAHIGLFAIAALQHGAAHVALCCCVRNYGARATQALTLSAAGEVGQLASFDRGVDGVIQLTASRAHLSARVSTGYHSCRVLRSTQLCNCLDPGFSRRSGVGQSSCRGRPKFYQKVVGSPCGLDQRSSRSYVISIAAAAGVSCGGGLADCGPGGGGHGACSVEITCYFSLLLRPCSRRWDARIFADPALQAVVCNRRCSARAAHDVLLHLELIVIAGAGSDLGLCLRLPAKAALGGKEWVPHRFRQRRLEHGNARPLGDGQRMITLLPCARPRRNASTRREQHFGDLLVALCARNVQRSEAICVGGVRVGSSSQQLPHARHMVIPRSVQQGCHAAGDELPLRVRLERPFLTRELETVALKRGVAHRGRGDLHATRLELGAGHGQPLRFSF